jgi:hypothetical protein
MNEEGETLRTGRGKGAGISITWDTLGGLPAEFKSPCHISRFTLMIYSVKRSFELVLRLPKETRMLGLSRHSIDAKTDGMGAGG